MYKIFITLVIIALSVSSHAKTQKKGGYVDYDVQEDITKLTPDESLASIDVEIPAPKTNLSWKSSHLSLTDIPENITLNSDLKKSQKHYLYSAGFLPSFKRVPVIQNNLLFVLDNEASIYAFDAVDPGKNVWIKDLVSQHNSKFLGGGISVEKQYLAVSYGGKQIVLLNSANGNEIWRQNLSNISRVAPLIYRDKVFALTVDNKLYCFDLKTGSLKWTHESASGSFDVVNNAGMLAYKDNVLVPFSSGILASINIENGQILWQFSVNSDTAKAAFNNIDATPVVSDNGMVYLSTHKGILFALKLDSGESVWKVNNVSGNNSIWLSGDFLYTANANHKIVAIYKDTGAIKWVSNLFNMIDQDRALRNTKFSGPIMINSILFVPSSEGKIIKLSPKTGKQVGEIQIARDMNFEAIAVNKTLYLMDDSGYLLVMS